jgi:acyl-CoA dehydrogenase
MIGSPRILDRALGTITGDLDRWRALEDILAQFVATVEAARIDDADEAGATRTYVRMLAEAGLLRWMVPAQFGGHLDKLSSTAICLIRQWLARTSGALDNAFVMQGLGSNPVTMAGPAGLREALLPRVASGAAICAFALTEPEAGSDIKNMRTTATRDGEGVRLRGDKCFISNAGVADSYVVFAREADSPAERPRFGAFWLPGDAPGLTIAPTKVIAPHPIGALRFEDVIVPAEHRIGAYGDGLKIALANLEVFRVTVGAAALGLADRALAETVQHLKTRVQFGQPLASQQGLQFALADVATDHTAAQLLVYRAAGARDEGRGAPEMAAMAKMFATESAQRTIDRAVQSFGGRGVTVGEVPERLYREIRALRIYEGTTEVQKLVIARALLG